MRVLHVLRDLSRNGGVQRLVFDLVTASERMDWQTEVVIFHREQEPEYVDELRNRGFMVHVIAPWQMLRLWQLLRRFNIVHAHLFPALYLVGLLRPGSVYTEHNTTNNRRRRLWLKPIERWIYSRFRKIICISPEVRVSLLNYLEFQAFDNTLTIYNGIDVAALASETSRMRSTITTRSGFSIAMIGSLTPKKDQETLIKSMVLLPEDMHLHLAGGGPNLSSLQLLAQSLNVVDRVHFHGVITDVTAFLANMDLYVQSSRWEGFGLAAIEAMACEIPTLCADVPGLNNLSDKKEHLFKAEDVDELVALIRRFRSSDSFKAQLASIAKTTASKFSLHAFCAQMDSVYRAGDKNGEGCAQR